MAVDLIGSVQPPELSGRYDADDTLTREFLARGAERLSRLPGKPERTPAERDAAERLYHGCRQARLRFVEAHGARVHDELTGGRRASLRLEELATAAAARYPGLVPTVQQLRAEREHVQAAKEGHEIDHGIFAWGLLRSPVAGTELLHAMRRPTRRAQDLLPEFRRTGRLHLGRAAVERSGDIARVTIHNEEVLNAEDDQLVEDLETAVDLALLDDRVRVGVLRGAVVSHERYRGRRVFSAGINLTHLYHGRISFLDFLLRRELGPISKIMRGLYLDGEPPVEKPWLAAVDTFAIGGGMQLLLVFDCVVAASDAYLSLPAVQEGIIPGAANLRLPRRAGSRLARQMILGGRRLYATDPEAMSIFDEVTPPAELDRAVEFSAERLTSSAVVANRHMLNLAEEPAELFRGYMAEFALEQSRRLYHPEVLATIEQNWIRRARRAP